MLTWNCGRVRSELSAFYDEELSVADRIAISDHLEGCASCRLEADDLEASAVPFRPPRVAKTGRHAGVSVWRPNPRAMERGREGLARPDDSGPVR